MFDCHGRVWLRRADVTQEPTSARRAQTIRRGRCSRCRPSHRQLSILDPRTEKYTFIDTCFQTHHLQFGYDANDTLWTSSGGGTGVVGWLNLKMYEETGDAGEIAGLDADDPRHQRQRQTRRLRRAEPAARPDQRPRFAQVFYAVMPNPADGSIWARPRLSRRGCADRSRPEPAGDRPTRDLQRADAGLRPRGGDIDSKGVVWVSLGERPSSAAFDRRKCKGPLNGPRRPATIAPRAGRSTNTRVRASRASAPTAPSSSYYTWVDQHDTFGLGKDVPISTANLMDGLVAYARTAR